MSNGGTSPAGFHRSSTRPRVYATNWVRSPPATGTLSTTSAQKMEIGMLMARMSTYGDGCIGGSGQAPTLAPSGTPQLGQILDLGVTQAPAFAPAFAVLGFANGAPFPIDLGFVGMPGCFQYVDVGASFGAVTDAAGAAPFPVGVPGDPSLAGVRFYTQWVCADQAANAAGLTTSDYARVLVGM